MIGATIAMLVGASLLSPGQCNPMGGQPFVTVRPVVRQTASGVDLAPDNPPAGDASVAGANPFVIELWAQQEATQYPGFISVHANVNFNGTLMSCDSISWPSHWGFDMQGVCGPGAGTATNVGGTTLSNPHGTAPEWMRVATVHMTANQATTGTTITLSPASNTLLTIAIQGCGNVPSSLVTFETAVFDIDLPCTVVNNCDDGQFCNGVEICDPADPDAGLDGCVPGTPVDCLGQVCDEVTDQCVDCVNHSDCNDSNPCTDDFCDDINGVCVNFPPTPPNDPSDGLYCNGIETCVDGVFIPGTPPVCDDSNPCTDDVCQEGVGTHECVFVVDDTNDPDDGLWCNGIDVCQGGVLIPGNTPNCHDPYFCTDDFCDEANDQCVNVPPPPGEDLVCNDGNVCNGTETCDPSDPGHDSLGCVPGTPLVCDNGQFCDGVESCNPSSGCQPGTPVNCVDAFACTADSCNETVDACLHQPNHALCNDGLFCNGQETCSISQGCVDGPDPNCDDGIACTIDVCIDLFGECFHNPVNSNCSDGQFCNGQEICDTALGCIDGPNPDCDDGWSCTVDSCNETTDTCDHALNNSVCNDGSICNGTETCNPTHPAAEEGTGCVAGATVQCDDNVTCTEDFCDEAAGGCVYTTLCEDAVRRVRLEWRPPFFQDVETNDVLEIGLYVVPDDNFPQLSHLVAGIQAVVQWESPRLELLGVVNNGPYPWAASYFPDDSGLDNLNAGVSTPPEGVPFNDGEALYLAEGQFYPPPLGIGPVAVPPAPDGLLVTTFRFKVLDGTLLDTQLVIAGNAGAGSSTCSHVFYGGSHYQCLFTNEPCDNMAADPCPNFPNDVCIPIQPIPNCDIGLSYGTARFVGPCEVPCGDVDGNGISDDNCVWYSCLLDECTQLDRPYGDAGGAFGECMRDNFVNVHDANHALSCFSGASPCDPLNIDVGGAFGACPSDGFCNIHDANHALSAFSGINTCSCPSGAAPQSGPQVVGSAGLSAIAGRRLPRPGEEVEVDIVIDDALRDLRGYQLDVEVSGGRRGQLELVDIFIADRADQVFTGIKDSFAAFNVENGQMLEGLQGSGVATNARAYLATYTYRVSPDALGTFVVTVHPDRQTYLIASHDGKIDVKSTTPAVIGVAVGVPAAPR